MKRYHIWTIGCQMNVADSGRVAGELDALGYAPTDDPQQADVIVLNTCVVRQAAEEKAVGHLLHLRPLKDRDPRPVIALMGCLVGIRPNPALRERFPFVDVFMPPSDPAPLVSHLSGTEVSEDARSLEADEIRLRHALQDGDAEVSVDLMDAQVAEERKRIGSSRLATPMRQSVRHLSLAGQAPVTANVPVVYGCSHACTFCIIPSRRGSERSRPLSDIVREVEDLVAQGVREVTLLGQIVDRYGKDFTPGGPDLADLLRAVNDVEGLWRVRFLTSHPNYMTDRVLQAVAALPKVCEQIEVPIQAGDDDVLQRMRRGYTADAYRQLVAHIRQAIPGTAIHTDIIVGFPGETDEQFQRTYDILEELQLDKAHLAMYSPRPGTVSSRTMADDVPLMEKRRRLHALDQLQAKVVGRINSRLVGQRVEVLVDALHKGNWRGRARTNKLVFFKDPRDWRGQLVTVRILSATPYSMSGVVDA